LNKRQRKKKIKREMKHWNCDSCGEPIKVFKEYEPEHCCDGYLCGCYGYPINPIFCTPCERKIYGKPIKELL
jgi:hypothetical protein